MVPVQLSTVVWSDFAGMPQEGRALLANDVSNPFLNPDWMEAYGRTARRAGETYLLIGVRRAGKWIAVAAFVARSRAGIRTFRFLTEGRADFNGIAGEQTPEVFSAVLGVLRERGGYGAARFADIRADSLFAAYLRAAKPAVETAMYPCPYRSLSTSAPVDSPSNRKFQSRIPSYLRRMEVLGKVELRVLDFDADRAVSLKALPALFALHDLRHAGRRNSWKRDSNRAFLRMFLEKARCTHFLAFVTQLDGVPVAFDLGFRAGNRFVLYIPAFHPSFEKFRLGHINRHLSFQACRGMGIDVYDFSRGDSFAKRVWAHGVEENIEFSIALHSNAVSRCAARMMGARERLKSSLRKQEWPKALAAWIERRRGAKPVAATSSIEEWAGVRPLRYGLIAGLDQQHLNGIAEAIFARGAGKPLNAEWLPGTLRISGNEPEFFSEIRVSGRGSLAANNGLVPVEN